VLQDVPPEVKESLPGALGSLSALLWLKGSWPLRIGYFCAGTVFALYGSPLVSSMFSMDRGLAGYVLGMFGMALAAKGFELIEAIDVRSLIKRLFNKFFGLKAELLTRSDWQELDQKEK
jgi:hypothetical protein